MSSVTDPSLKYCGGCQRERPLARFSKNRSRADGLTIQCKDCYRAYHARRFAEDPAYRQKLRDRKNAWYAANAERAKARERAWNVANNDIKRARRRAEYANNPEAAKARVKRWNASNPLKRKGYSHTRRARQAQAPGVVTAGDIEDLLTMQKRRCGVCGMRLSDMYHVDHIKPLSKGGSNYRRNLQILCVSCNTSKSDRDPIEFMRSRGRLI